VLERLRMRLSLLALLLVAVIAGGCGGGGGSSSSSSGPEAAASGTVVGSRDIDGKAVLVDGSGRTLYAFAHGVDCAGKCADAWPPLLAHGDVTAKDGSGVDEKKLGTAERKDGSSQVTYDDEPLYLYAADDPGKARGAGANAFGGAWDVVRMSGNPFKREKTKGPSCEPDCGY
jgi:predicted lipoprotein with Yx(FWY)xxD motif